MTENKETKKAYKKRLGLVLLLLLLIGSAATCRLTILRRVRRQMERAPTLRDDQARPA
jgi:hypothetical protein